jgi:hypothetical protein
MLAGLVTSSQKSKILIESPLASKVCQKNDNTKLVFKNLQHTKVITHAKLEGLGGGTQ